MSWFWKSGAESTQKGHGAPKPSSFPSRSDSLVTFIGCTWRGIIVLFAALNICTIQVSAQGLDRRVNVVNKSKLELVGVYAMAVGQSSWGQNRINGKLQPDYQLTFDFANGSGSCNMKIHFQLALRRQLRGTWNVCETSAIVIDSENSANLPVKFVNRGSKSIRYLYVGGSGWWSADLLGPGISIFPDAAQDLVVPSPSGCTFNVRAVAWDNSDYTLEGVDLCASTVFELAQRKP